MGETIPGGCLMLENKDYILAVYREKSFSRAAQKLYVSQPWLSAKVKKVEQELGLPLFDRSTNPISLTEAGRCYVRQAERVLDIEAELEQQFRELKESQATELRIGSSMFFCTYVLPTLLADFKILYPQIILTFSEGSSQRLTERMLAGELDFVLEAERPAVDKVNSFPWASEEIVLAVPAHYQINEGLREYGYTFDQFLERCQPGKRRPAVPLSAFREESFLLLNAKNDICRRSRQLCQNAGFTPSVSMQLSQMMTAYYLVCEGRGITFLRSTIPEYVAPTRSVIFYQLDDPLAVRSIYLSYPKRRSGPVLRGLIDFMQENARLEKDHRTL